MKVLLINPPSDGGIHFNNKIRLARKNYVMPLGLCCVAAPLLEDGHEVKICDMNVGDSPYNIVVYDKKWDYIGITATTFSVTSAYEVLSSLERAIWLETAVAIIGGVHATAYPQEAQKYADDVCIGEGDRFISYLAGDVSLGDLKYDTLGLDGLPIPAYHLLDHKKYTHSRILAKKSPVGLVETSRGCYGKCTFCTKGRDNKMRFKSATRVVDEMETLLDLGYREVHVIDDNFTADMKRVYKICEEIKERKLKFPWYPRNGVRVDRASVDMFKAMKDAGCYRLPFGVETGTQDALNRIGKGITVREAREAVGYAKQAGLETETYFMIGLPDETKEEIEGTIHLACKMNPDLAKFSIMTPLPGSELFDEYAARGLIKTHDWSKYNQHSDLSEIFDHDTLTWDEINYYSKKCYRKFYLSWRYLLTKTFSGKIFKFLWRLIR